jgi:hypothetical protein
MIVYTGRMIKCLCVTLPKSEEPVLIVKRSQKKDTGVKQALRSSV